MKADLLRARDMKRYINQLTVAKKQCEKRIRLLGGPNYENSEEGGADDGEELQSQKVRRRRVGGASEAPLRLLTSSPPLLLHQILQFDEILCNPGYRDHFRVYMERVDKRALISFWELVDTLKTANKVRQPGVLRCSSALWACYAVDGRSFAHPVTE